MVEHERLDAVRMIIQKGVRVRSESRLNEQCQEWVPGL